MKRILLALLAGLFLVAGCAPSTSTGHHSQPSEHGNFEATSPGPASSPHCGIERWAVKTGTDSAASQVNLNDVHQTDINTLIHMPVPSGFSQDAARLPGAEFTVYQVTATLVEYKMEADSDYHLILHDNQGNSMIAEIPSPACVGSSSPFAADITHARKQFDAKYSPGSFWQPANVPVVIIGVGFFDTPHGQTGVAPNAIELHPVLDIQFIG